MNASSFFCSTERARLRSDQPAQPPNLGARVGRVPEPRGPDGRAARPSRPDHLVHVRLRLPIHGGHHPPQLLTCLRIHASRYFIDFLA